MQAGIVRFGPPIYRLQTAIVVGPLPFRLSIILTLKRWIDCPNHLLVRKRSEIRYFSTGCNMAISMDMGFTAFGFKKQTNYMGTILVSPI